MKMSHKNNMDVTLLIHTKTASFSWGKILLEQVNRYIKQQGIQLQVISDWQQAVQLMPGSFVLVNGSEETWLEEVLSHLEVLPLHIILLEGVREKHHDTISRVISSQSTCIQESLELLGQQGRSKTALFGCQFMDTSDAVKADTFARLVSEKDVYSFDEWIDPCFEAFSMHLKGYDSVICANDLIAVYLMKKCRDLGLQIPKDLMIIGNGNLRIGSFVQPSLTTCYHDIESTVAVAVQICKNFSAFPNISSMEVSVKPRILKRESTGNIWVSSQGADEHKTRYSQNTHIMDNTRYAQCPELLQIKALDAVLSVCSSIDLQILQGLIDNKTYEEIAVALILSKDTIKYHIQKLYRLFGIRKREELIDLALQYHLCFKVVQ